MRLRNSTAAFSQALIIELVGRVAQLGERGVRNAEVEGSNPFASTNAFGCRNWKIENKEAGFYRLALLLAT